MNNSSKDLFTQGIKIIEQIEAHQFEAYFVGGCVRDHILGVPITDVDITTSATPEQLQKIFPHLIPIGIDHGTVLVRENKMSFEITRFRTDASYEQENIRTLEEDVKRRDFTMNAVAMDRHFQLIDYTNGVRDIESRTIRAVGDPLKRMHSDPLRILRGLRFVSQFGYSIEQSTVQAMKQSAYLLESVATERIYNECEQLFAHVHVREAVEQLHVIQADHYLPIFKHERTLIETVKKMIQPLKSFSEVIAVMHVLAPEHSVTDWINGWKCSNEMKREAHMLVDAYTNIVKSDAVQPYIMYKLQGCFESFIRVYNVLHRDQQIDGETLYATKNALPIANRSELAINGYDILQLFPKKKQGKWINEILIKIEYMVVTHELPNIKERLKEWVICNQRDFD